MIIENVCGNENRKCEKIENRKCETGKKLRSYLGILC